MMTAPDNGLVLSKFPDGVKRVHLLGIAGTGMGSFAGLLKAKGFTVTGSDENVYPPMSDQLRALEIQFFNGYDAKNLDAAKPDVVIVGNVIRRENVEAAAVRERKLPSLSFPAAFGDVFLTGKHSIVVAGTHGKTTTSALMSHVLVSANKDPSFLVGGVTLNTNTNSRFGHGAHVVVEGDEYDTAYFDKGPKFLHYQPSTTILTSVEFDHADIYRDTQHYESSFEKLMKLIRPRGLLVACGAYESVRRIGKASASQIVTYSRNHAAGIDVSAHSISADERGTHFHISYFRENLPRITLPLWGLHNVENALAVYVAARHAGLSHDDVEQGFSSFLGVKRRQELLADKNRIVVVHDFAHHPTAVRETIDSVKLRYANRRLWAIFEPRSNTSRRNIHQHEYPPAFERADRAVIKVVAATDKIKENEILNVQEIVDDIRKLGRSADGFKTTAEIFEMLKKELRPNDVALVMSNGSFDGLATQLADWVNAA